MGHPSSDDVVQKTDHVPSAENVPKAGGDDATAKVWKSGDCRYRVFLQKN